MKHELLCKSFINPFVCKWSSWIECDNLRKKSFINDFVLLVFHEVFSIFALLLKVIYFNFKANELSISILN